VCVAPSGHMWGHWGAQLPLSAVEPVIKSMGMVRPTITFPTHYCLLSTLYCLATEVHLSK